eukprot:14663576-Ditylum_brightwellii.AAC.1
MCAVVNIRLIIIIVQGVYDLTTFSICICDGGWHSLVSPDLVNSVYDIRWHGELSPNPARHS